MRFLSFQVLAGLGALGLGIWSFGVAMDARSVQRGPDGVGMEHVTSQSALDELEEKNANYPMRIPWGDAGAKAGEAYENVKVLGALSTGSFTGLMNNLTNWVAPVGGDNQHPEGYPQGCNYCHNPEKMSSDEYYTKHVSRRMIQMTQHINENWKTHVGETGVNCWTCHRGKNVPEYIWFEETPDPNMTRMVGGFSSVNKAHPEQGLTSLPSTSFSDYLYNDMNIRVVGPTALPTTNTRTIKQTEATYGLMMHMSNALGVNCTYCHNSRAMAEWGQSPITRTKAWYGIRMVRNLNQEYLVGQGDYALEQYYPEYRLGELGDVPKINCETCHQGAYKPVLGKPMIDEYPMLAKYEEYVPPPKEEAEEGEPMEGAGEGEEGGAPKEAAPERAEEG